MAASTWAQPVRLSDATRGAPYKNANGYTFPYGDYFDLDVNTPGTNVVIWGEGPTTSGPAAPGSRGAHNVGVMAPAPIPVR